MQIVIDIPEDTYQYVMNTGTYGHYRFNSARAIRNGIPLPKGHGRLIDADKLVYWECNGDCDMCCDDDKCGMVKEAPTIIEGGKE